MVSRASLLLGLLVVSATICVVFGGKDYYQVLGISRDATPQQIKKAFRELSLKYHPDQSDAPDASEKFAELSNAYQVLSDPDARRKYDQFGEEGLKGGPGGGGGGGFHFRDAGTIFEQFFGGGFGGGGGGPSFTFTMGGNGGGFGGGFPGGGFHGGGHGHRQQQQRQRQPQPEPEEEMYKDGDDDITILTGNNFNTRVLADKEVWLVQFYSPNCGHCKKMAEEFKKAAQQLRGMVKVGVVDGTKERGLVSKYGVEGFPTLLLFPYGEGKGTYETHNGARHATAIANFAVKAIPTFVTEIKKMEDFSAIRPKDSSSPPLVLLFTDKKKVPPMLSALSKDYKEKLKFGIVYAQSSPDVVNNGEFFGLVEEGNYPALLLVEPAKMTKYKGTISYLDIRRYLLTAFRGAPPSARAAASVPQHIFELNKGTESDACSADSKTLCVIALVSSALPSREAVSVLEKVQAKFGKDGKFTFSWVDESSQPHFRSSIPFSSSDVRLLVINPKRHKFVEHEGKFEATAVSSFLDRVLGGDKKWTPLNGDSLPLV